MIKQALIIFCENSGVWWLKGLKKGFRHCFMIAEIENEIFKIEATFRDFTIELVERQSLNDLISWYQKQGMLVLHFVPEKKSNKTFAWSPFTCVEVLKRLLGIKKARVLTPWQFYQFIIRTKNKLNENSP